MLIAGTLYVGLMLAAVARGELEWKGFLTFALAGLLGLGVVVLLQLAFMWFTAWLIVLDLLLILIVFKGHPEFI